MCIYTLFVIFLFLFHLYVIYKNTLPSKMVQKINYYICFKKKDASDDEVDEEGGDTVDLGESPTPSDILSMEEGHGNRLAGSLMNDFCREITVVSCHLLFNPPQTLFFYEKLLIRYEKQRICLNTANLLQKTAHSLSSRSFFRNCLLPKS